MFLSSLVLFIISQPIVPTTALLILPYKLWMWLELTWANESQIKKYIFCLTTQIPNSCYSQQDVFCNSLLMLYLHGIYIVVQLNINIFVCHPIPSSFWNWLGMINCNCVILFKKYVIFGKEMLVCLWKSARIQPPHSWMKMPACITSLDSVPVAKKSNSLVTPSLVNHNL